MWILLVAAIVAVGGYLVLKQRAYTQAVAAIPEYAPEVLEEKIEATEAVIAEAEAVIAEAETTIEIAETTEAVKEAEAAKLSAEEVKALQEKALVNYHKGLEWATKIAEAETEAELQPVLDSREASITAPGDRCPLPLYIIACHKKMEMMGMTPGWRAGTPGIGGWLG